MIQKHVKITNSHSNKYIKLKISFVVVKVSYDVFIIHLSILKIAALILFYNIGCLNNFGMKNKVKRNELNEWAISSKVIKKLVDMHSR